jgi:hypothetical protein
MLGFDAIRRGLISENPAAKAGLPRPRRPRPVVWTRPGSRSGAGPENALPLRCGQARRPPRS